MNKQQWMTVGSVDAKAGNMDSKPKSGWQLAAYMAGWESEHDQRAVKKAEVNKLAKELGIAGEQTMKPSKKLRSWAKKMNAVVARVQHNQKMRGLTMPRERRSATEWRRSQGLA